MPRSLRELLDMASGKSLQMNQIPQEDFGTAESMPYPFLAIVGQMEMKIALLLNLVNPGIGGVLLIGPRGTGKTTAVRSLLDLLPDVSRSNCFYGCLEDDIKSGGMDAVCPNCAKKYAEGQALSHPDRVRLVELPLNARIEDVVGGLDERAAVHERMRIHRGILAHADRNILYADEVNLLDNDIVDAILDASAQGSYTVRRGPLSATYRARFTLIGSMNPEEGNLRPQILDRFGLRVIVHGLSDVEQRLDAYNRVRAYRTDPHHMIQQYQNETNQVAAEILSAKEIIHEVQIPKAISLAGIQLIQALQIDSLRAEITLLETARAYAAADFRREVTLEDLRIAAPMALRMRRSAFMTQYIHEKVGEDEEILRLFPV